MPNVVPFHHEIATLAGGIVEVTVSGQLTSNDTEAYLSALGRALDGAARQQIPVPLLFVDRLSGFETAKVPKAHGAFFASKAGTLDRVAVVTEKISVTFGLAAARLLAPPKQKIQTFKTRDEALRWLRG